MGSVMLRGVVPIVVSAGLLFGVAAVEAVAAPVPAYIDYQGKILDGTGRPVVGPVDMEVGIFDAITGGTEQYHEAHAAVPLTDGVYDILIGTGTPTPGSLGFNPGLFRHPPYYLEVTLDGETLAPRQPLASVGYAIWSWEASLAQDSSALGGQPPSAYDQSAHVADTANPHGVTAAQAGAATPADVADAVGAHGADASAHHAKTTSFTDLTDQAADAQIPAGVARDSELTWGHLLGIPSGFSDGVDNGLIAEDDPQVGALTTGAVPRWDGSALVNGVIHDVGGKVGVGVAAPQENLDLLGGLQVTAGNHYFQRGTQATAASTPRCDCDTDASILQCGEGFFSNAGGSNTCYDWYDDFAGGVHTIRADRYSWVTTPISLHVSPSTGVVEAQTPVKITSREPTLVLHDTTKDGIRPRVRFENNGTAVFEGDDAGDQSFNFYTTFSSTRNNDAHVRAYGSTSGSWGKYAELTHDGTNGKVATDTGDLILAPAGTVKVNTSVTFPDGTRQTTAYRGFPRPNYDSGWVTKGSGYGTSVVLTHNLGGNTDDYVVDLTFKNTVDGPNIKGLGSDWSAYGVEHLGSASPYLTWSQNGAFWEKLTTSTIKVSGLNASGTVGGNYGKIIEQVRVRIWVYQ